MSTCIDTDKIKDLLRSYSAPIDKMLSLYHNVIFLLLFVL